MAALKIKKIAVLRRRFIEGALLKGATSWQFWMDEGDNVKKRILTDSTYQLVGDKIILRINEERDEARVCLEVLGIPQLGLKHHDNNPTEILIYDFPEGLFDVDFLTIKARAKEIRRKIAHSLEDGYDIVFEGRNLALHFFMQKDYIQSTQHD